MLLINSNFFCWRCVRRTSCEHVYDEHEYEHRRAAQISKEGCKNVGRRRHHVRRLLFSRSRPFRVEVSPYTKIKTLFFISPNKTKGVHISPSTIYVKWGCFYSSTPRNIFGKLDVWHGRKRVEPFAARKLLFTSGNEINPLKSQLVLFAKYMSE